MSSLKQTIKGGINKKVDPFYQKQGFKQENRLILGKGKNLSPDRFFLSAPASPAIAYGDGGTTWPIFAQCPSSLKIENCSILFFISQYQEQRPTKKPP